MECWLNDAGMGHKKYLDSALVPHCPLQMPNELGLGLNTGLCIVKMRRVMFTDNDALLSDIYVGLQETVNSDLWFRSPQ
jgi:hypothetical protein